MDNYNIWADLLDTFQSPPDWIKALCLIVPPAFLLALAALLTRRTTSHRAPKGILAYSVYRGLNGELHAFTHLGARTHVPAVPPENCSPV